MTAKDPLRLWLQEPRYSLCSCDHCFKLACEGRPSPIEMMMANAFAMLRDVHYWDENWSMHHEWPVLIYKADLVLVAPSFLIVIECDGHDYHERTKEQAAHDRKRDRAMTEAGIVVLRFTGSEIWKNPFSCAEQVLALALSLQVRFDQERRSI
jgi:very-short-patch-repair endonuclease